MAHGLDPNDVHSDGFTPFHRALWGAQGRHTDTVRAFLKSGLVDPNKPGGKNEKQHPLEITTNKETRKVLIEYGATLDKTKHQDL